MSSISEVMRAIDVVGCIADDNELFRREIHLQVFANPFSRTRGQVATIVRLITKRTRQCEEAIKTD